MVRFALAGNSWTCWIEIVQEACKERSVAKDDDAITQATMNDRFQALSSQMGMSPQASASLANECSTPKKFAGQQEKEESTPKTPSGKVAAAAKPKAAATKGANRDDEEDDGLDLFDSLSSSGYVVEVAKQAEVAGPTVAEAAEEAAPRGQVQSEGEGQRRRKCGQEGQAV